MDGYLSLNKPCHGTTFLQNHRRNFHLLRKHQRFMTHTRARGLRFKNSSYLRRNNARKSVQDTNTSSATLRRLVPFLQGPVVNRICVSRRRVKPTSAILFLAKRATKVLQRQNRKINNSKCVHDELVQRISVLRFEKEQLAKQLDESIAKISSLQATLNTMTLRLSAEMSAKISTNECTFENVSIQARPLSISSEYSHLLSYGWLNAKVEMDNRTHLDEENKVQFLFHILMVSNITASMVRHDIINLFCDPFSCLQKSKKTMKLNGISANGESTVDALARGLTYLSTDQVTQTQKLNLLTKRDTDEHDHITTLLTDFWRKRIKEFDLQLLEQTVVENLRDLFPSEVLVKTLEISSVKSYLSECVDLAWKMAIQRPPMQFLADNVGEIWNNGFRKSLELMWNSQPKTSSSIKYYKSPKLYHGDRILVKGQVFVE